MNTRLGAPPPARLRPTRMNGLLFPAGNADLTLRMPVFHAIRALPSVDGLRH